MINATNRLHSHLHLTKSTSAIKVKDGATNVTMRKSKTLNNRMSNQNKLHHNNPASAKTEKLQTNKPCVPMRELRKYARDLCSNAACLANKSFKSALMLPNY